MVSIVYQTMQGCDNSTVVHVLVIGFTLSLTRWWDEQLTSLEKQQILKTYKLNNQGELLTRSYGEPISDAINTLIFTITKHFVKGPNL